MENNRLKISDTELNAIDSATDSAKLGISRIEFIRRSIAYATQNPNSIIDVQRIAPIRKRNAPISDDEIKTYIQLQQCDYVSNVAIAKHFNVSTSAIQRRRKNLGM